MKSYWIAIMVVICAGAALALPPRKQYTVDYNVGGRQYHIEASQWEAPDIQFTLKQGTNYISSTNYTYTLHWGKDENATSMSAVTGTLTRSNVVFTIGTNDFYQHLKGGYTAIKATSNTYSHVLARGIIDLRRAPEITASTATAETRLVNRTTFVSTNDAPTLIDPAQIGDELVIYSSTNIVKVYKAFGITTNGWGQIYP